MKTAHKHPAPKHTELPVPVRVQQILIGTLALSWLVEVTTMLNSFTVGRGYWNASGLLFQVTTVLLPLVFMVLGVLFAMRRYRTWLARFFAGGIIGTVGLFAYQALYSAWTVMSIRYHWFTQQAYTGTWSAFGREWVVMLIGIALFVIALGVVGRCWKAK